MKKSDFMRAGGALLSESQTRSEISEKIPPEEERTILFRVALF